MAVPPAQQSSTALVIGNGTVYPSPTAPAIPNGVVIIRDGVITDVGVSSEIQTPAGAETLDARGGVIVAGFQNSHIHFSEPQWSRGATQPAGRFTSQFEAMFTRFGFTTVVDTGSSLEDARAIRDRVASGEVAGPRVLTAGIPLYPAGAIPYYLRDSVPPEVLARLHQPVDPAAARQIVDASVAGGADLVKLFTGSWVTNERAVPMRLDVAQAAVDVAHARGRLVFAHASNVAGLEVALAAGVDVVAHAIDDTRGLTARHYERMRAGNVAMVPTLTVIGGKADVLDEVRQFRQIGGVVLFGTDAGYIQTYNPVEEYEWLARAGLGWRDILAALTTAPAATFGDGARRGQLARGMAGDVTILRGDPGAGVRALADVRATVRDGRVIYSVR